LIVNAGHERRKEEEEKAEEAEKRHEGKIKINNSEEEDF